MDTRYGFYFGNALEKACWGNYGTLSRWWVVTFDMTEHGTLFYLVRDALDDATYCDRYEPPSRTEL